MNKQFFMITLLVSSLMFTQALPKWFGGSSHKGALIVRVDDVDIDVTTYVVDEKGNLNPYYIQLLIEALRNGKAKIIFSHQVEGDVAAYLSAKESEIAEQAAQKEIKAKEQAVQRARDLEQQVNEHRAQLQEQRSTAQRQIDALRAAIVQTKAITKEALAELEARVKQDEQNTKRVEEQSQRLEIQAEKAHEGTEATRAKVAELKERADATVPVGHKTLKEESTHTYKHTDTK